MNSMLQRVTRFWCAHEYVERTRRGHVTLECVGCGKTARDVQPIERKRLEALVRMDGSRRSVTFGH